MRKYLVLLFGLLPFLLLAQTLSKKELKEKKALESVEVIDGKMIGVIPWQDGGPFYSEVIEKQGSKEELYTRARSYFAENFGSAKRVLEMDDKDAALLIGNTRYNIPYGDKDDWLLFTIKIQCKDNRYKYDIYNVSHESTALSYEFKHVVKNKTTLIPYEIFYNKNGRQNTEYANRLNGMFIDIINNLKDAMDKDYQTDIDGNW